MRAVVIGTGDAGGAVAIAAETIAARVTPPGHGGVGIVRVSGPDAWLVARRVFRPRGRGLVRDARGLALGALVQPGDGRVVDEVLALWFPAPHSYTTEDVLEIQGHGGVVVVGRVLEAVLSAGARAAMPGEFTRRAFLGGRLDLLQAEAIHDLITAPGERALEAALRQLEGTLSGLVQRARTTVMQQLAALEGSLDFPDEVPDSQALMTALAEARELMSGLLATAPAGLAAREGLDLVLLGFPNAGKSSLLNALLGEDRALVDASAGTTRDRIEVPFSLGGFPIRLVDTAGLRHVPDGIEARGIAMTRAVASRAPIRLWLVSVDESGPMPWQEQIGLVFDPERDLVVRTKADLLPEGVEPEAPCDVLVSALTGQGLQRLQDVLVARVAPRQDRAGEGILVHARHRAALERAISGLDEATGILAEGWPSDMAATPLRSAVQALGTLTGVEFQEDLLDQVFGKFCIGK
ncbi:MAG: tRNA uridine-5-carboxymethylaminomethyl(34) synthesis GTPase MnmE [Candidatus Sericytochromatia bacterium]|nr:tRNA uridine-5-carboxymethylaminomethyl(34) synthesis GTPase MnmE [Candidatus Sericytochromatia bacterium]